VHEAPNAPRASQVVKECCEASIQFTYEYIYNNCSRLACRENPDKLVSALDRGHVGDVAKRDFVEGNLFGEKCSYYLLLSH